MRAIVIDRMEFLWRVRRDRVLIKAPDGASHEVPLERLRMLDPDGQTPSGVTSRHLRWWILRALLDQPERADKEARRHAKKLRKARRKQCPAPPPGVSRGMRDVHLVIAERGQGAAYSWDVVGVYDCPAVAAALAGTRNRAAFDALRALDPLIPDVADAELFEVLAARDPRAWRLRVETRLTNQDPAAHVRQLAA